MDVLWCCYDFVLVVFRFGCVVALFCFSALKYKHHAIGGLSSAG